MRQILILSTSIFLLTLLMSSCHKKEKEKGKEVAFKTIALKEEHHLNNDVKNPMLNIELNFQYPISFADDSILKKIRKTMLSDFLPNINDTASNPEMAMRSYINSKIKSYESSEERIKEEDLQENGAQASVAWKDKTSLLIRCNTNGILSYSVESTQFSGGAHGGLTFKNAIIDLQTGEKISEEDLFTEQSLPLLNDIVLKKLESQNNVENPEDLEQIGYFDVSQIGQYKNIYLTKDGLVYTFNEGEIGAYALGTIEVKLSFQDLEGFITSGSLLDKLIHQ